MARFEQRSTVLIDDDVVVGDGVVIWDFCRVRRGARIGTDTKLGAGVYIGAGVVVGARCKIQNGAQIFEGAHIGDGVFVGPGAILTNDRHPRAITPDGRVKDADDWAMSGVTVEHGASIGAGVVVVGGARLGPWSMVAAGAVIARSVEAFELVAGVPARHLGWVCRCARPIEPPATCSACRRSYLLEHHTVLETER